MPLPPDPRRVELSLHPDVLLDDQRLIESAAKQAGVATGSVRAAKIVRRAIDARRGRVRIHATVEVYLRGAPAQPSFEPLALPPMTMAPQVAIVGAGPAGMFCAWELARHGVRSVVFDRGKLVQPRRHDLAKLSRTGVLDPESNYCFGEGGAGTFSDGKLYTRASKRGPTRAILEALCGYGASPDILVDARPHIGTNRLPDVITCMREHLADAGVSFELESRVDGLLARDGRVAGVRVGDATLEVDAVVLATGHSARDVFSWLHDAGVRLSFKPFAVGVRVEHPQMQIDRIQFGSLAGHAALGAASYRFVEKLGSTSVYSFCMCPGGIIAPASTDPDCQVTNGWSPSSRGGRFANSGIVVEVDATGLDAHDALAGVAFQRKLEQAAYRAGGGGFVAPAQRLDDFVGGRPSVELPDCSYPRGLTPARVDEVLGDLAEPIRQAIRRVDDRMGGFIGPDAVVLGVESRTSSPVRIDRDAGSLQSSSHPGLYPCGEGAGFAGGIVSAAIDGLRVARAIAEAGA